MWIIISLLIGRLSLFTLGEIIDKPLLQEIVLPKNLAENQTFRLLCALTQGESVSFEWFHNNKKIKQSGKKRIITHDETSELVIKTLSIDDLGDYSCTVKNRFGKDTQNVSLFFDVKPKFTKEPEDVKETISKYLKLECDAKGYPVPIIEWTKLTEDKQKIKKTFTSNTIKFNLNKETIGFYKCTARNLLGSIDKTIQINYFGK